MCVFRDNKMILFSNACRIAFIDMCCSSVGDLISIGMLLETSSIIASHLAPLSPGLEN
jgi:hypothetical protein